MEVRFWSHSPVLPLTFSSRAMASFWAIWISWRWKRRWRLPLGMPHTVVTTVVLIPVGVGRCERICKNKRRWLPAATLKIHLEKQSEKRQTSGALQRCGGFISFTPSADALRPYISLRALAPFAVFPTFRTTAAATTSVAVFPLIYNTVKTKAVSTHLNDPSLFSRSKQYL